MLLGICVFAVNLLFNPDFSLDDGMGNPSGWSCRNVWTWAKPADWRENAPKLKTLGDGVTEITFRSEELRSVAQKYLTLVPGARYRMAADVRVAPATGAALELAVFDESGALRVSAKIPDGTGGNWQTVAREFAAPPSGMSADTVSYAIRGRTGSLKEVSIAVRGLMLEPLDEPAIRGSRTIPGKYTRVRPVRIVPVEPLLDRVSAEKAELAFYWPGRPQGGVEACTLRGTVGGRNSSAPLDAMGCARLDLGKLAVGKHTIAVRVVGADGRTLATNDYQLTACAAVAHGPAGRRLNNFATELVKAPLTDGAVRFYRPEDGWVWISFEGASGAGRGYLDGGANAVVRPREGERRMETQRYVKAGWHTLAVSGAGEGGTLRIHAVKAIAGEAPSLVDGACKRPDGGFDYKLPFMRRFDGLAVFNTMRGATRFFAKREASDTGFFRERGLSLIGGGDSCGVFNPNRQDRDLLYRSMASVAWRHGLDVLIDENPVELCGKWGQAVVRYCDWAYSENVWRMIRENPLSQVNTYYSDSNYGAIFRDRAAKASEISAIVNSGRGTAMLVPEAYAPSLRDPEASAKWEGYFARFLRQSVAYVPAARGRVMFWMAPYIGLGGWSSYTSPEVDLKAHYSRLLRAFATQPEFADIGGVGFGGLNSANDEVRRWGHRILRHYCIEGGTDDIAARYGYAWAPRIVRNADFDEAFADWTAAPAAEGSVKAERIAGYGHKQGRQNRPNGIGDGLAVFTVADRPNRLEQKLTGLRPGGFYSLEFAVVDYPSILDPSWRPLTWKPAQFTAKLEGAQEIGPLSYVRCRQSKDRPWLTCFRFIFRAGSSEATLVFTDRAQSGMAAPAGTRYGLNHIVFTPYYMESPEELSEIVRLWAGKQ